MMMVDVLMNDKESGLDTLHCEVCVCDLDTSAGKTCGT